MSDDAELFSSRPERTVACACCHGTGTRRDTYALRAPSSVDRVAARLEGLDGDAVLEGAVVASVAGASSIFECCREALEIAERSGRPVTFRFNDRVVSVKADDDPLLVAKRWWVGAYGKTYEQSMEER